MRPATIDHAQRPAKNRTGLIVFLSALMICAAILGPNAHSKYLDYRADKDYEQCRKVQKAFAAELPFMRCKRKR